MATPLSPQPPYENFTPISPLRRTQRAFRPFVYGFGPQPTPTQREFYTQNILNNALPSYEKGFVRYFEEMKQQPVIGGSVIALSAGLGLLLTAFRSHRKIIEAGALMALSIYPVVASVQHLPRIMDSYELIKEGEPTKAKETFKKSFDELVYNIFHVYLKPLTLALFVFFPLINIKQTLNWIQTKIPAKGLLNSLKNGINTLENTAPVKSIDRFAAKIDQWGDRVIQGIYRTLPFLKTYDKKYVNPPVS